MTDRKLITGPRHLHAIMDRYAVHYNQHRPHRALNLRPPSSAEGALAATTDLTTAKIRHRGVLGGLINKYEQAA